MSLFGQNKKTRSSRAASIGAPSTLTSRITGTLRNRGMLLQFLLCLSAMVILLFAVQAWRAPFPYRVGDRPSHGIAAKVDFKLVNRLETERAKAEREEQVPYVFQHDPRPLHKLPDRLRSDLLQVAQAPSLQDVPEKVRQSFRLVVSQGEQDEEGMSQFEAERQFAALKAAVSNNHQVNRLNEEEVQKIINQFVEFLAPVEKTGLIDPNELTEHQIHFRDLIAVASKENPKRRLVVSPSEVQLSEILKDSGKLAESWEEYPALEEIRPMLRQWLLRNTPATLRYDAAATQQARREAREHITVVPQAYSRGELLVEPGQRIDEESLAVLRAEYKASEELIPLSHRLVRVGTVFLMLLVLAVLNGYYLFRNEPYFIRSPSRLGIYLGAIVVTVALGRMLSFDPWRAEIIPLIVTAMIFAIAYNQVLATLMAFTLALVLTLSTVSELGHFVILMSVSATAVIPLSRVSSRSALIKVGFWSGLAFFAVSWGMGIVRSQAPSEVWSDTTLLINALRGAGWCLAAGYLVAGSLPFIESGFGVVTNISLLEMGDISHPLLQELVARAPGTYNHSITVAAIAEAASDRIGANGLLCRVGAYFHDIGKMLKPQYFIENITAGTQSRHEHLAPAMSTLIIIGHVKDGVDLAKHYNLPQPLIDFIEQHHGTTLVEYFYHEATRQADLKPDHKTDAEEASFRYPGPKPQSREAGVLMLADAVEGASRALNDPAPRRIESLVHAITMKRLLDGQFDESSLTLAEIRAVEDSLTKTLIGIYHGRIKYPEQQTA